MLDAAARGQLDGFACEHADDPHVGVVLASGGYPGRYDTGLAVTGIDEASTHEGVLVFHAGTAVARRVGGDGGRPGADGGGAGA